MLLPVALLCTCACAPPGLPQDQEQPEVLKPVVCWLLPVAVGLGDLTLNA